VIISIEVAVISVEKPGMTAFFYWIYYFIMVSVIKKLFIFSILSFDNQHVN